MTAALCLVVATALMGLSRADRVLAQEAAPPGDTTGPVASALHPDTVFRVPRGPRVVILDAPESPLVSLRLLVPLIEGAAEAGSARVLQEIRLEALRPQARQIGARVQGSRTRRGLAYSVSGTLPDFDYLAWLVRQAVADPRPGRAEADQAIQTVRAEAERARETAEGRLRARLRERVWPNQAPTDGNPASLGRMNPASLRDFWARTHQAGKMTLVVVGDVDPVLTLATFQGIGAPGDRAGDPLGAPAPEEGSGSRPQILRTWFGQAFVLEDGSDPRPAVASALMARQLQDTAGRVESTVELWEAGAVSALIVMAAAYREDVEEMRRMIRELPERTARALDRARFDRVVGQVRADLVLGARTPWGLASLVGHFVEGMEDPRGAERFLAELEDLELEEMRSFLLDLQSRTPIQEELRP